ncbi:MAG: hypothetical protein RQ714_08975 [Nitrosomonas sp.]|nr:hypothetical protein [Nitrosomonas sp.]
MGSILIYLGDESEFYAILTHHRHTATRTSRAIIACPMPEIFSYAQPGERINRDGYPSPAI